MISYTYRINNRQLSESYQRDLLLAIGINEVDLDILLHTNLEPGQKLVGTIPQNYHQREEFPPACIYKLN
jgi:sporulation-control protein spo0M